jgi:hypothetical protein
MLISIGETQLAVPFPVVIVCAFSRPDDVGAHRETDSQAAEPKILPSRCVSSQLTRFGWAQTDALWEWDRETLSSLRLSIS